MIDKLYIYIVCIFIIIICGSSNIYPIYLQRFVDKFNFPVTVINLYGSFVTLGGWVGFPIGLIYDYYGPKISSFIGTILLSGGYYFLHLILSNNHFETVNTVFLLLLGFILGQGNYLLYTSAVGTSLKNFNFKQNSIVLGILLSNTAAAPSLFSTCRQALNNVSDDSFYFYLSLFILINGLISILIFNKDPISYSVDPVKRKYQKYKEKKVIFLMIFYNLFIIIIFIVGILINYHNNKYRFPIVLVFPVLQMLSIIFILFERIGVVDKLYETRFKLLYEKYSKSQEIELGKISENNDNKIENQSNREPKDSISLKKIDKNDISSLDISREENERKVEILPIIKTKEFIMLFIIVFLGLGSVISNMSNLNFILKSISYKIHYSGINKGIISIYKSKEVYFYVMLYFIFNSLTRIICSVFLDLLKKRKKINIYLIIFSIVGLISQLFGITMEKKFLYISISLAGCVHGAYVLFLPSFIQLKYGLNSIGSLFGILLTAGGLGSLTVSETAFSFPYSYFGEKTEILQCVGKKCFSYSYLISSLFFGINIILSCIISYNGKPKEKIK